MISYDGSTRYRPGESGVMMMCLTNLLPGHYGKSNYNCQDDTRTSFPNILHYPPPCTCSLWAACRTASVTLPQSACLAHQSVVSNSPSDSLLPLLFFLQAEAGIRDLTVTGVQTCALPICPSGGGRPRGGAPAAFGRRSSDGW